VVDLLPVSLDDKYKLERGRIFVTGIQALVRLPLVQRRRDEAEGLSTAGYITGYRGSPLGGYDQQLQQAKALLDAQHIVHQPGVNEELAATACQGTQQVGLKGESRYNGVFAIWYGKGPGVDRSGDAIKHGNLFGTAEHGGVLCLLGDDHICESSTTAHQSEYAMVDAMVPILSPSDVAEILEYGLLGIALSRYSGAWVALKCVHDTVECTASIEVDPDRPRIVTPEEPRPKLNIDIDTRKPWPPTVLELERRLHEDKMEAARAFARANRLDRVVMGGDGARLGVVTTGKAYQDLIAALDDLGIDAVRAEALGLRVYKVGLAFPLEPVMLERAVAGLEKVVVLEEKRGLVEGQLKEILYASEHRPQVVGKRDEWGAVLFPSNGQLDSVQVATALGRRLLEQTEDPALRERVEALEEVQARAKAFQPVMARLPWYCPGCPHNTSTVVPEGSEVRAGIGCHFMGTWMDRSHFGFTQMGGEGAGWLGEAPFSTRQHVFQNVGDGTFYHSGSLAVRAAVASGANITFKILFNDAVAMTGGQKMEIGNLTVPRIARLLEAEGVTDIAVVTDEPEKYPTDAGFPKGARIHHRDELNSVQKRLAATPGVTALIYDQTCAAEKRRRRKRGTYPDPDRRVLINEEVCEGCGDCGVQSNCVAIQPAETELGRKRRIDQSACNKDFSCLKGFCPSFVEVTGAKLRKEAAKAPEADFPELPEPTLPALDRGYGILVAGIGGTGVVTIAALLAMAAHLEGKGAAGLDMIGLAQKGGAVVSHLKIAAAPGGTGSARLAHGGADLVLGCDLVVAAGKNAIPTMARGRTRVVANLEEVLTGQFTREPELTLPTQRLKAALTEAVGEEAVAMVEASALARKLLGDGIGANLLTVGYAWQKGWIPLSRHAIERAIELNGVAVAFNKEAFLWGRRLAHDPDRVQALVADDTPPERPQTLDGLIDHRAAILTGYQNASYADRYRRAVARLREAEQSRFGDREDLTEAAARYLFKLMAYKDEYEVARLYSSPAFEAQLKREFEGWKKVEVHLAPPLFASRDPETGRLKKRRYGPWIFKAFRALAAMRGLRGSWLDPFAYLADRKEERRLISEYEALMAEIARDLTPATYDTALELLRLPDRIRGYGHVKSESLTQTRARQSHLLAHFRGEKTEELMAAE